MFEWTQPVGRKSLKWKPLTLGQEMDIISTNRQPAQQHLVPPMLVLARIVEYDGKTRSAASAPLSLQELRDWDAEDYRELLEHIDMKENERRVSLRKQQPGAGPVAALEAAIDEAQAAANRLSAALSQVLEQAKAHEASQAAPLA